MAAINNAQALDPITGFTLVDGDIEGLNDFSDEEGEVSISVANTLHITRATPDEYLYLSRVLKVWILTIQAKNKGYKSKEIPSLLQQSGDCKLISELMGEAFADMPPSQETYVYRDDDGIVQGMIFIDQKPSRSHFGATSYVENLITAPHNLRARVMNKKELNRTYGVGTALLKHAEYRADELGHKYLEVHPMESSKQFYCKYEFSLPPPSSLYSSWFKTITPRS